MVPLYFGQDYQLEVRMTAVELISAAVALISAFISWRHSLQSRRYAEESNASAAEANRIQRALLEVELRRDAKAEAALNRAEVTAEFEMNWEAYEFVIRNHGPGVASAVSLRLTNMKALGGPENALLRPGDVHTFKLSGRAVKPEGYVEWAHPSGEKGSANLRFKE